MKRHGVRRIRGRLAVLLAVGLVTAAALSGCGSDDSESTASVAAGGIPAGTKLSVSGTQRLLEVPLKLSGLDKDLPYDVKYANLAQGSQITQALVNGDVDVATPDDAATVQALAGGVDGTVVGVIKFNGPHLQLVTGPGKGINTIADLRGKSVAYTAGSAGEGFLLRALAKAGLKISDIKPVSVPAAQVFPILTGGKVDAAVIYSIYQQPYFKQHPDAKQLLTVEDLSPGYSYDLVLASNAALKDGAKRAAIQDYVGRLVRVGQWGVDHPDAFTKGYVTDVLGIPAAQAKAFYASQGPGTYPQINSDLQAGLQEEADVYFKAGLIPKKVDVSTFFDAKQVDAFNKVIEANTSKAGTSDTTTTP